MITAKSFANFKTVKLLETEIDPYFGTPFYPIRIMSSRKKGAWFEKFAKEVFVGMGLSVFKPKSSDHDMIVNKKKVEIKASTLWDGGNFRWQQIRISQDYDIMVFIAMWTDRVEFFWATKQDLEKNLDPYLNNQHGGMKVASGTMFIDGIPSDFKWMKEIKDASFIQ